MKNAGLCEELVDGKYEALMNEMIHCASIFSQKLKSEKNYEDLAFAEKAGGDGLRTFFGYTMDKYDGDLREHALEEWKRKRKEESPDEMNAAKNILDILGELGKKVKGDQERKDNKDLNLVLHYEIKTVIRFLLAQLSRADVGKNREEWFSNQVHIARIGYNFSHYYHYVPSNAFPLAERILEIAKKAVETPDGEREVSDNFALYEVANLYKVMGDIHRLLGQKEGAIQCYRDAKALCDEQLLLSFGESDNKEPYKESLRIMADVLLTNDYYDLNAAENKAETLYGQINYTWGKAYYNQRMGEKLADKKLPPASDWKERQKHFETVLVYYNNAAKYYSEVEDSTGLAYVLKCMGDLIGRYRDVYKSRRYRLTEKAAGGTACCQINISKNEGVRLPESGTDWTYAAAYCYAKAFTSYCRHINWRGFANVLQGMGNLLRFYLLDEKENTGRLPSPEKFTGIQTLFEVAEECYRWLGDIRGLADTLDYAGHGYKEMGGDVDKYMALGKWMESEEIWRSQGNDEKVGEIAGRIRELRAEINRQEQDKTAKQGDEK